MRRGDFRDIFVKMINEYQVSVALEWEFLNGLKEMLWLVDQAHPHSIVKLLGMFAVFHAGG